MIPSFLRNRPFIPLASERLTLRPLEEGDAPIIASLANDRRIAERLARLPHPYRLEDAYRFVAAAQEKLEKGTHLPLAVIRRNDQTFLGVIGLEDTIGYWLGVEYWGQGYGKEAAKALVEFSFLVLQHEQIKGSALLENKASRRIFEGLGFSHIETKETTSLGYEGTKLAAFYTLSRKDFLAQYQKSERPLLWAVAAALINKEGQLLLAERPSGASMAGVWELPGGKIEAEETPEAALIRELKEELDIEVRKEALIPLSFISHPYDRFHLVMPLYICHQWEGTPHGVEGQKLAWVNYFDFVHMPTHRGDILLAHQLADHLKAYGVW